jgi:hypothetical protein
MWDLPDGSGFLALTSSSAGLTDVGSSTGTLPIANGGTGATTAVAAFDALAPTTTKGDLIVSNGTDNVRVAVGGTNGHVLTVDSAEATGVKWAAGGGGLVDVTETLHTSSPNNTVNALQLEVTGGTTNTDLVLTPKGTGAFILGPEPDGTATGGNKRGEYAVDLARHTAASYVASGNYSFAAGQDGRATGTYSVALGRGGEATGLNSVAIGNGALASGLEATSFSGTASGTASFAIKSTASGNYSFAQGFQNTASATLAIATGYQSLADRYAVIAHASGGAFSAAGDAQSVKCTAKAKTTTNSAVEMYVGPSTERFTIPSGKVFSGTVNIVSVKSDGTAVARYLRQVTIKNVAGTTALVGSVITLGTDEAASTSISITADDTNDSLKIQVTGITSETWRWVATIEGAEVAYGN